MQEIMARQGMGKQGGNQQNPEQEKQQDYARREADEHRQMMLSQILSSQARERIARIALVKPEKARGVEEVILRAAQTGQIVEKVYEERLITLLEQINSQTAKQTKVTPGKQHLQALLHEQRLESCYVAFEQQHLSWEDALSF